jgi:hypothetical protein
VVEGTPNRVRATAGAERPRALRASRSVHESREWARCVRDRGAGANVGLAERLCSTRTSTCWCRSSCMHTRRWYRRLQSCQSTGAEPITNGCEPHAHLARLRGCATLTTLHCSRSGQGRQLRILAPYTMRRLPSASLRCSCGISCWEAWQRSVPSVWSAKSWPEKRPAFQGKPT